MCIRDRDVTRIAAPYKKANRLFHPEDTIVEAAGIKIGGNEKIVDVYKRQVHLVCLHYLAISVLTRPCQIFIWHVPVRR